MDKPTVAQFKAYFYRDFPYATSQSDLTRVIDADITKAIAEAAFYVNEGLFSVQDDFQLAYMYLTAHYLCTDLMNAKQGLNGQYNWLVTSKSVGNVSESYQIPEFILKNPTLAMMSKTTYGAKYLSIIAPLLVGPVYAVGGRTLA
jgi:hypothetical protein